MPGTVPGSGKTIFALIVFIRVKDKDVKNDCLNKYLITIVINAEKEKDALSIY